VKFSSVFLAAAVTLMGSSATIEKFDPALDAVIAPGAALEKVAGGYTWTEGPVWIKDGGYLLFADIPANAIWKYTPGAGTKLFMQPSGWAEKTPFGGKEPGSNGMTLDAQGRLTVAGHANRNVWRLETMDPAGAKTILADHFEGKRFNSPNDLVYRRNGDLYFTDPPYGLATQEDTDPKKELKVNGVYRLAANGKLQLIISDLTRPNGIAFSPDEQFLYVDCSDPAKKTWMKYPMKSDGTVGKGILIADVSADPRIGSPDGIKVDRAGNLAWGGADGRSLYVTASSGLYRIQLKTGGVLP